MTNSFKSIALGNLIHSFIRDICPEHLCTSTEHLDSITMIISFVVDIKLASDYKTCGVAASLLIKVFASLKTEIVLPPFPFCFVPIIMCICPTETLLPNQA